MKVLYFEQTHIGARETNQDYYAHCLFDDAACFVVADGLGGHPKGEVASREFCKALMELAPEFYKKRDYSVEAMEVWISSAWRMMCENILAQEGQECDPHTTFVLAWMDDKQLVSAHMGDSRLYRLSRERGHWRTPDHTLLQRAFEAGEVQENEFLGHRLQNYLLKTLNIYQSPEPEFFTHPPLVLGESILLCTDGFWAYLEEKDWDNLVEYDRASIAVEKKITSILQTNPKYADNITVQWVGLC